MMHCVANGHEIVALANLYSQVSENKEEIDSFMYQTVGSNDVVPMIAQCLDLPLYRRLIRGTSLSVDMEYTSSPNDEVEDLFLLLQDVKKSNPDITAISVGAILSSYQRIRVENVAGRLGMTVLSYLWQGNQRELVQGMLDTGFVAVLAKVAAVGLDTTHLGKTLAEVYPLLLKLEERFGVHVCGEGGEYETVVLDCPLFKKRLEIVEKEVVVHSQDSYEVVAYLRFKQLQIVDKPEWGLTEDLTTRLLESGSHNTFTTHDTRSLVKKCQSAPQHLPSPTFSIPPPSNSSPNPSINKTGAYISISNIRARTPGTVQQETHDCMSQLIHHLQTHNLTPSNITSMHLYVADMSEFAALNAVYGSYFGVNPPTRVTVQVGFPVGEECRIQMDCLAFDHAESEKKWRKSVMHVQGVSYWAPSNIGPYSQTHKLNDHLHVAGQIGLIPHKMTLPELSTDPTSLDQLVAESLICFNNLSAIADVQGVKFPEDIAGVVCFVRRVELLNAVRVLCEEKIEGFNKVPSLFLVVPVLPRSCAVEYQVLFQSPNDLIVEDDDDDDEGNVVLLPKMAQVLRESKTAVLNGDTIINATVSSWSRGSMTCVTGVASISDGTSCIEQHHINLLMAPLVEVLQSTFSKLKAEPVVIKFFHRKEISREIISASVTPYFKCGISFVPVDAVGVEGEGCGLVGVHVVFPHRS
ncbi:hypothetical protein HDU79_001423 [Rhizoclosmatium sp. JEL0117]|nr:hypothetical protein HDU79_001423 [Rhizoclosmatium sp. JEL0117]